jgi:hypothetical protein
MPLFPKPKSAGNRLDRDAAETIAARALGFMAEDEDRLARFMADTGIDPDQLRDHAASTPVLTAVLDFVARDESLLLMFAANADVRPDHVAPALAILSGELTHAIVEPPPRQPDPDRPSKIMRRAT